MISNQEFYDKVKTHLLTQMKQSLSDNKDAGCLYRDKNGNRCAIGGVLPESIVDYIIQSGNNQRALDIVADIPRVREHLPESTTLAMALQGVHDLNRPDAWADALKGVASNYNLIP